MLLSHVESVKFFGVPNVVDLFWPQPAHIFVVYKRELFCFDEGRFEKMRFEQSNN